MRKYLYILTLVATLVGCKSASVVTVPQIHTSERDNVRTEYLHDSVWVDRYREIWRAGDTVYIHDTARVREYHKIQVHDTIRESSTDTIYKAVERPYELRPGDRFLKRSGIALWILIGILVVATAAGIVIKIYFRK